MDNSKLNIHLINEVLQTTLPNQPPILAGQVSDSSLFLAGYQNYAGSQIVEHSNPFHTLEIVDVNLVTPQKRRMGDYKTEEPLKSSEIYFCPAQANYSLIWDREVDFTLIAIDPETVAEIAEIRLGWSDFELIPQSFTDLHPIQGIVNLMKEEIKRGYQPDDIFLKTMRNELIASLLQRSASFKKSASTNVINIDKLSNKKVKLIHDYIMEHLSENILLDDLADFVGISKYHLSRSFAQAVGLNLTSYIIAERIKLAKKLLINTSWTIADIASACGFCDASHLNRNFKDLTQMTPTAFRKSNKNRA